MTEKLCSTPLQAASYGSFEFIPSSTCFVELPAPFRMKRGGKLYRTRIGYETYGKLNNKKDNVILLLTGLSANAHACSEGNTANRGWWDEMIGSGKYIDTDKWFVICLNPLGSCKGSTGPASINPVNNRPYRLDFPVLSIEDIANAVACSVLTMGIHQISCVIGLSMGGMVALALTYLHPELCQNQINICSAMHSHPFAIAMRSLQRELIINDLRWQRGNYDKASFPSNGVRAARKLGMITYRSALEWECRFSRKKILYKNFTDESGFGSMFEIEKYLGDHADQFRYNFDPNSFLYLSRSMDLFDLLEYGNLKNESSVFKEMNLEKALVIGSKTDFLFPLSQQADIARGFKNADIKTWFLAIDTIKGHDAFLIDIDMFGHPIRKFLGTITFH